MSFKFENILNRPKTTQESAEVIAEKLKTSVQQQISSDVIMEQDMVQFKLEDKHIELLAQTHSSYNEFLKSINALSNDLGSIQEEIKDTTTSDSE